ncbi:RING-H2 finger protein ATL40-like [Dendrobium catenatum]|uniref:RING-H2 finger protein ATL28 n=1 Tax=Dendrobium catenatum TaxID=906689 RepID=A0A2I0VTX3_9ASPA|nr:RING-H2 finger protein ATL40-like [Dendrobium catenatum]PKU66850.1 RING-H2 finger protein ATL28 [Dendrobium catenatum]
MIPKPLIILLYLLDLFLYAFSFFLHRIGLNPSFEIEPTPWDDEELLFSSINPRSTATPKSLASQLPIVEYLSFVEKQRKTQKAASVAAPECAICLRLIEDRDRVRELGNCSHAFHVTCMDRWLDLRRFSCPLCRSAVAPAEAGRVGGKRGRGPLWVLKVLVFEDGFMANGF